VWNQALLEIGHEDCSVHGSIKHERRDHLAAAQANRKGGRFAALTASRVMSSTKRACQSLNLHCSLSQKL
jgi:hypothetical protein